MKWLALTLTVLFTCGAYAQQRRATTNNIVCQDLNSLLQVHDDTCDYIAYAAEKCFQRLNREFYAVKQSKQTREVRTNRIQQLTADYERALVSMGEYERHMSTLGEGQACIDASAELEVWIEQTTSDLSDLRDPRF